jgi:hypothetical protein
MLCRTSQATTDSARFCDSVMLPTLVPVESVCPSIFIFQSG